VTGRIAAALATGVDTLHIDTRAVGDTMTVFHPPREITAVESVFRWFFSVPQWVQQAGALLAIVLGIAAVVALWLQRKNLVAFARRRHLTTPTRWKVGIGIVALLVLGVLSSSSVAFYTYSQQNNQFCLSCHTLHDEVFQRFQQSKHHTIAALRCHDCHDESLYAETRQIVYWMTRRPTKVGPHAPVPRQVCANCHIRADADSTWKRIAATAGHTVHLLSDTAKALHIECLTCHGVTAHRFVPVGKTCAQSGCHANTPFKLGKMADQTSLHCTVCHNFTAPIDAHASMDSAKRALIPVNANCQSCHAMQKQMADFIPANDPHKGRCGDCHDPHKQISVAESWKTCTNSGCHARADTLTAFHRGLTPKVLADCSTCHKAHTWNLKGAACLSCHKDIYTDRPSSMRTAQLPARAPPSALVPLSFARFASAMRSAQPRFAQDTTRRPLRAAGSEPFQHGKHRGLACTACHDPAGAVHGALLVRTKTDCESCHHGADPKRDGSAVVCVQCHTKSDLARAPAQQPVQVRMSVYTEPKARTLPFAHALHSSVECATCHTTAVTRAVARDCTSCHTEHHVATASCITCHAGAKKVHRRQDVHQGCSGTGCHKDISALGLTETRNVCLTCHNDRVSHKPGQQCAKCHQVKWAPSAARTVTQ
jgi:nitrate/TMAO reductase-like tetraheme cytochrome c subunit